MTENTMAAPVAADDQGGSSKKTLLIAGGVAAALVLGGAGYKLMSGGGSSNDESFSLPVHKPAAATTTTKTLKSNVPTTNTLPAASTVRLGRDPFSALYVVPVVKVAVPTTTGEGVPVTSGTTGTTGTTTGTTGTTGGTTTPAKAPTPPVATTYPLKLVKVGGTAAERTATFTVNGKTQLAKVGSVFGKTAELKLLSLQQTNKGAWVAVVQVGDADPFDLNVNESILVM